MSKIFFMEGERTRQILYIQIKDQALCHIHLSNAETKEIGTALPIITGGHRRGPVAIEGHGPIFRQIGRERTAGVAIMIPILIDGLAVGLFLVGFIDKMQPAGIDGKGKPCAVHLMLVVEFRNKRQFGQRYIRAMRGTGTEIDPL